MRFENRPVTGALVKVIPSLMLALLLTAGSEFGWGGDGHKVVAEIAAAHLTPEARAGVQELLGPGVSMADVSSWADRVRRERKETAPWHYVNYPIELDEPDFDVMKEPGGNVAWAVQEMTRRVQDTALPEKEREEALKFLIHLAGDLHQPLHAGTGDDAGGNGVDIVWNGEKTNLHKAWDGKIIESRKMFTSQIIDEISAKLTAEGMDSTQRGGPYDWMVESHVYARDVAYANMEKFGTPAEEGPELSGAYANAAWPIVERRLAEAGLRLAMILNHIYAEPAAEQVTGEAESVEVHAATEVEEVEMEVAQ